MLKRILILSVSLWLIVAGGLAAHAAPCHMETKAAAPAANVAAASVHAHCDMMAAAPAETPDETAPGTPAHAADSVCCCPAVIAALPAPALPGTRSPAFRLPAGFPLVTSAPSLSLIPEPPPPKA
ncbi:MAG: hypothetical protein ACK4MQ_05465 [Hyphomonas sp.]